MPPVSDSNPFSEELRQARRGGKGLLSSLPGIAFQRSIEGSAEMELLVGAVRSLTGHEAENLVATGSPGYSSLIHPEDREAVETARSWDERDPFRYETKYRISTAGGELRWVWERGQGVFSDAGELLGLEGFIEDVTSLTRTTEKLEEANRILRGILDQSLVGVFVLQEQGFTYVNPKLAEVLGMSVEAILHSDEPVDLLSRRDRPRVRAAFGALLEGQEQTVRTRIHVDREPDRKVHLDLHATCAVIEGVPSVIGTVLDVTDRLIIKRQYREAQKLESVARMASGIAHDFNNLLTAITGTALLALDRIDREGSDLDLVAAQEDLHTILAAAEQERQLTRQLLTFSRQDTSGPRPKRVLVDLSEVLTSAEWLIRRMIADRVELVMECAPGPLPVVANAEQLHQILLNLVMNAEDAMTDGGTITIRSGRGDPRVLAPGLPSVGEESWVFISVTDDGPGIPPSLQQKIFEPFFTTKERGKGTGLGLASAYGIAKDHGGALTVESSKGAGATFRIVLPPGKGRAAKSKGDSAEGRDRPEPVGHERLLVVDDDPAVRKVLVRILQRYGYEVLDAASSEEALALTRRHNGTLDLLVTDIGLPRMRGTELAEAIQRLHGPLPVLLISGYSEEELRHRGLQPHEEILLEKPFDPRALGHQVRKLLDEASARKGAG